MSTYIIKSPIIYPTEANWGDDPFPSYSHDYGTINTADTAVLAGARLNGTPSTPTIVSVSAPSGYSGEINLSMRDIYYSAVYFLPTTLTISSPVVGTAYAFKAWNATFSSATVTGLSSTGGTGVTNTLVNGTSFNALELKNLTITLGSSSPVIVNAVYTYSFDTVDSEVFTVLANRAFLFDYTPQQPIISEIKLATDVLKAIDGTEQRISYLDAPDERKQLNFFMESEQVIREIRQNFYTQLEVPVAVPEWVEGVPVYNAYTAGATSIVADFSLSDIAADDSVYLSDLSGATTELVTVTAKTDTMLTLGSELQNAYVSGDFYVYPVKTYLVANGAILNRYAFSEGVATLNLTRSPRVSLVGYGGTLNTYNSLTLLDKTPVYTGLNGESLSNRYETIDFGGKLDTIADQDRSDVTFNRRYCYNTQTERQYWKKFIATVKGAVPFYVSTFRPDLELNENPVDEATQLVVKNPPNYTSNYFTNESHKHLEIVTSAGTIYRGVSTSTATSSTVTTLTLDSALPAGYNNITRISFLLRARISSDTVKVTDYVAYSEIDLTFRTVDT